MKVRLTLSAAGLVLATACVPQPEAPTQPETPAPVSQPEAATPPPPPARADWRDIPLTPGNWFYAADANGSSARFGATAAQPLLVLRCDRSRHISLSINGAVNGTMTVRTSFGARNLPLTQQSQGNPRSGATLASTDPLLDSIAFSRGRFTIEAGGQPMLVLPAWAEPARVVEDCRS